MNKMKKTLFNSEKLRKDLMQKRIIDLNLTVREAGVQIGISAATVSRVENKKLPDVETFFKICKWLNKSSNEYLTNTYTFTVRHHKARNECSDEVVKINITPLEPPIIIL